MRLVLALLAVVFPIAGQVCPATPFSPAGTVSGKLDNSNCLLSDWTAYAAYRVDLPVRGRLQAELSGISADLVLTLRDAAGSKVDSGISFTRPLEAGSYTLLVNGRTPGQVGGYTVSTKFTAAAGILCTGFPLLGTAQTVSGNVGASGCTLPDRTPYEGYRLIPNGAGTLTIAAAGADFDAAVLVRDEDGWLVESGAGSVTAAVERGREYRVVVHGEGKTGAYKLTTSFEPQEEETCRARKTLTGSGTEDGAIGEESCSDAESFYDYWPLKVATPGVAALRVTSGNFQPALVLLDEGGNALASDPAEIRMQLSPGNYSVKVASGDTPGGAYQLNYEWTEGLPQGCSRRTLVLGEPSGGTLTPAACRTSLGAAEIYNLTLPAAGTVEIDVTNAAFRARVALEDAKENLMVATEEGGTHLAADLPAGEYLVTVAAAAGSGGYDMQAKFTAHELEPCGYVQKMAVNTGYIQRLGPGSCRTANGLPMDLYEFILDEDSMLAAVITSNQIDGYLALLKPDGTVLRQDDNSYALRDALVLEYLPAGTYRVMARAASGTAGGIYRLDLLATAAAPPVLCAPRALSPGASVNRSIGYAGCQYSDSTFADVYEVKVTSEGTLDIRLTSSEFDAELILLDGKGNVVARDEDGGGGSNARILHPVEAGSYFVVAKPAGDYRAGGVYVLTVTQ